MNEPGFSLYHGTTVDQIREAVKGALSLRESEVHARLSRRNDLVL